MLILVPQSAAMRLPGLAVLLAAVLLHCAAADSKCDPSSTNCDGAWTMDPQLTLMSSQTTVQCRQLPLEAPCSRLRPAFAAAPAHQKASLQLYYICSRQLVSVGHPIVLLSSVCPALNCTAVGPVKEGSVGTAQYHESDGRPYEDSGSGSGEYGDYDTRSRWQQEGGLEGAHVWGGLFFNTQSADYGKYWRPPAAGNLAINTSAAPPT